VLQILHMCEKISKILLPGKGVKGTKCIIGNIWKNISEFNIDV